MTLEADKEQTLGDKSRNIQETGAAVPGKDSIGLGSGISYKYSRKWLGTSCVLKLLLTELADGLDAGVMWMWDMKTEGIMLLVQNILVLEYASAVSSFQVV